MAVGRCRERRGGARADAGTIDPVAAGSPTDDDTHRHAARTLRGRYGARAPFPLRTLGVRRLHGRVRHRHVVPAAHAMDRRLRRSDRIVRPARLRRRLPHQPRAAARVPAAQRLGRISWPPPRSSPPCWSRGFASCASCARCACCAPTICWSACGRSRLSARNEDAILAATNLVVFVFTMTGIVYATQHDHNPAIQTPIDALYFTVTSLTTTGYGDITLPGPMGRCCRCS